jgi:hypothetical protein
VPGKPVEAVFFAPGRDYWEVACRGRYSGPRLLLELAELLPSGLTIYIEGTSIAPIVAAYFTERPVARPTVVRRGIIWPRPKSYHMPMTTGNVVGLAELMNHLAGPEVCDHLHAYRGDTAYLIWYDAWSDSPLYLRKDVPEAAVQRFTETLGFAYSSVG